VSATRRATPTPAPGGGFGDDIDRRVDEVIELADSAEDDGGEL
jgi:hypothetical protein